MSSRVAVVIVNWNLEDKTLRCLQSVQQQTIPCRAILVDNGSQDNSVDAIKRQNPNLELIQFQENQGFARACNAAIRRALSDPNCEFILLLNNDAEIHPQAVGHLLQIADASPEAGILGPKIYDMCEPGRLWYAGARRRRLVLAATGTGRGERDNGQYDRLRRVDYVFGAAMLVRREVFNSIGLLDERFFLYLEDLDFCLRAEEAGFSILFVPQAHVWHYGSASTKDNKAMRRFHLVQSTGRFLRKHRSGTYGIPVLLFWLAVFSREVLLDVLNGEWRAASASFAGIIGDLLPQRQI